MKPGRRILFISLVAAAIVVAIVLLLANREDVMLSVYESEGEKLVRRIPPDYRDRYTDELRYTLEKFWSAYEREYVTQNDLTDVVDRMRTLNARPEVTRMDIFRFIDDVSRLYTDAFNKAHEEYLREKENER